jgi:hypothetical protein
MRHNPCRQTSQKAIVEGRYRSISNFYTLQSLILHPSAPPLLFLLAKHRTDKPALGIVVALANFQLSENGVPADVNFVP